MALRSLDHIVTTTFDLTRDNCFFNLKNKKIKHIKKFKKSRPNMHNIFSVVSTVLINNQIISHFFKIGTQLR